MKKFVFIFVTVLFVILDSKALANNDIITGIPYKRVNGTNEVILSGAEAEEYKLQIMETENGFIWLTRENYILEKRNSGCYETYTSKAGNGIIVIIDNSVCKEIICGNEKFCFTYSEHIRNGLGLISYYGFIH